MRNTLTTMLLIAFFIVVCVNDSSFLTSSETQISRQSNSANWIELSSDLSQNLSFETVYSSKKVIKDQDKLWVTNVDIPKFSKQTFTH